MPEDRELAHAKLTRTLRVRGRRPDGYHLLESEMLTVSLADELDFAPALVSTLEVVDALAFIHPPAPVDAAALAVPTDRANLVLKALSLAKVTAAVRLTKRIPPGAGLGGGSADAAAVLRHFSYEDVLGAASLGADVPFCLLGGRALVRGIGELLEPVVPEEASFVIVTPGFGVSTAAVYACFDELDHAAAAGENDLAPAAFLVEPRLSTYRDLIASVAGLRPSLAGSGSSLFIETSAPKAGGLAADLRGAIDAAGLSAVVNEVACVMPVPR